MAKPKASDGRDVRQEVLDAALELFSQAGLHGTSMRDIARAVGLRQAAVYHYFAGKEALFAAVVQQHWDEATALISAVAHGPLPDDLAPLFEHLVAGALERFARLRDRKLFRIMLADGLRLVGEKRVKAMEEIAPRAEMIRLMDRLVKAGRLQGDPELLALEAIGPVLVWRLMLEALPDNRLAHDPEAFARRHVAHFLKGAAVVPKRRAKRPALNVRSTRSRRR